MLGRIIVLLVLILVLAGGGIIWFDYLNVIDAKTVLAPLYRFIGREGRTREELGSGEYLNLDAERLAVRLEAEALRELDMDRREEELAAMQGEIDQKAQELEQRQQALEDTENSINDALAEADNLNRNVEGVAQRLTNMQPERAVAIITAMNDQNAIDVLRKTEEIAQRDGTSSIVPYWLSLMAENGEGAARAAELQRKMVVRTP
ncbi:MAG: flagellar protein FlbB [Treponema sp.]|jgi:flagellar protein FlbB|nr:flagellar protein FlbB [Treponema sp.]